MKDSPSHISRRLKNKVKRIWLVRKKRLVQSLSPTPPDQKKVLLIIGCQRSGTTMMLRILERDRQSRVYGEFSELSIGPNRTLLKPFAEVKSIVDRDPAPFVVVKPLVETQRLSELFEHFPQAKAVWMFRHYKDVISSNLKNFGTDNGIDDLRPIAQGDPNNWRSSHASEDVQQLARQYFSEDMSSLDAAALFWYARNSLFFDMNLTEHPQVMISRYEDMVQQPRTELQKIYQFAGRPYPENITNHDIRASSIGKGQDVALHPDIEAHCQRMLNRLNEVYQQTTAVQVTETC